MNQPNENQSTRRNGEGLVVTEGGVRTSPLVHQTEAAAAKEAEQRKKQLTEKAGDKAPPAVAVKQQLFS